MKGLRAKFTPQYIQMKNESAICAPSNQSAETIAQDLEKQWETDFERRLPSEKYIVRRNYELFWWLVILIGGAYLALKSCKDNKQHGPNSIQIELPKWLMHKNWVQKSVDVEIFQARVVPIFKRGDTDNAANYGATLST